MPFNERMGEDEFLGLIDGFMSVNQIAEKSGYSEVHLHLKLKGLQEEGKVESVNLSRLGINPTVRRQLLGRPRVYYFRPEDGNEAWDMISMLIEASEEHVESFLDVVSGPMTIDELVEETGCSKKVVDDRVRRLYCQGKLNILDLSHGPRKSSIIYCRGDFVGDAPKIYVYRDDQKREMAERIFSYIKEGCSENYTDPGWKMSLTSMLKQCLPRDIFKIVHAKYSFSEKDVRMLQLIGDNPGIRPSEMTEVLNEPHYSNTGYLKGFSRKGLVRKERRGNAVNYYITDKGMKVLDFLGQ